MPRMLQCGTTTFVLSIVTAASTMARRALLALLLVAVHSATVRCGAPLTCPIVVESSARLEMLALTPVYLLVAGVCQPDDDPPRGCGAAARQT